MNFSTIEEAWGKKPNVLPSRANMMAQVSHPLVKKAIERRRPVDEEAYEDAADLETYKFEPTLEDALLDVRRLLQRIYKEVGKDGLDALLPRDYHKSRDTGMGMGIPTDIEDIARWLLIAAIIYIAVDLVRKV